MATPTITLTLQPVHHIANVSTFSALWVPFLRNRKANELQDPSFDITPHLPSDGQKACCVASVTSPQAVWLPWFSSFCLRSGGTQLQLQFEIDAMNK